MITAAHILVYADDPDAARAFFRDVLRWPNVDANGGWARPCERIRLPSRKAGEPNSVVRSRIRVVC